MKQKTAERNLQIVHLRTKEGLPLADIAAKYAVTPQQVCNILRSMGVTKADIEVKLPRSRPSDRKPISETHFLIGLRLGAARSQKDLTRPEAAEEMGIAVKRFAHLEEGTAEPTLTELLKITEFVGKPLEWLTRPRNKVQ
jgi:transcriptional regulator with XRE-family HTH domain